MQEHAKPDRSIRNKNILVAVTIFTLVTFNLVQLYVREMQEEEQREKITSKKKELVSTYDRLQSIQDELAERIQDIRQRDGKVDSLITLSNQIAREKFAISQTQDLAEERYQEIRGRLDEYEEVLSRKQSAIDSLSTGYKAVIAENGRLEERVNKLENQNSKLSDSMRKAESLNTRRIQLFSVSKSGKREEGSTFNDDEVKRLIVELALESQRFAREGEKTIYISIMAPNGQFLSNPMGETFRFKDQDIFFSAKKDFSFDPANETELEIEYARNSQFEPGQYQLKIYCDDQVLGVETFNVLRNDEAALGED